MTSVDHFNGFAPETGQFLAGLAFQNDREWFAEHKSVYETAVLGPTRRLVAELAPVMLAIDPAFDVNPKGGAVSRIYRDIRFAKDKSPYRTNQWISFKHRTPDWPNRPAFFMEFGADHYRWGMGFYAATPATMAGIRSRIVARSEEFLAAMDRVRAAGYALEGEAYKRPSLPPDQPAEIQEWFRLKTAYIVANRAIDATFHSPALVEHLTMAFRAAEPLYRLLAE